jgi:ubiquinone/menaquinone biosynthesis C-methylase UbiE
VPPVISTRWQLARDAAVRYQDVVVPWILGPFAEALVELAEPRPGEAILDVGCGTGAATRAAALAVGRAGRVVGLDLNVGMLEVARGIDSADPATDGENNGPPPASIEYVEASATAMPLEERSFDVVVSAQALQYIPEIGKAAREIVRVLKPEGRAAVSAWRGIADNPYFSAQVDAVSQRLGAETAGGLSTGFRFSDPAPLVEALTEAGLEAVEVERIDLLLNLPPLADWAPRDLAATPVAAALAGAAPGIARELGADLAHAMTDFVTPDGVRIPFSSWVIEGRAPAD